MIRLATFIIVCLSALASAVAQSIDPRILENPALLRLYEADPEEAERIMLEIDRILVSPKPPSVSRDATSQPKTRGVGSDIFKDNPLLGEIYRKDPKATLKLINAIQSAVQ